MKKTYKRILVVLAILVLVISSVGCSKKEVAGSTDVKEDVEKKEISRISLATGGTAGTYYPIGSAITAIITKYVDNVEATAESTGASVANSKMLRDGEVEMILVSSSTALSSFSGGKGFEDSPADNMRGITSLYPEVFHFVTLESSELKTVSQLKGLRVAVGAPGSGTERISKLILEAHGITYDDIDPQFLGFGEAITAMKDRLIDAAVVGSGLPTSAVVDISASLDINLLDVNKESMEKILKENVFLKKEIIPEGTYNGVDKDVVAIATPALLVTSDTMDNETVYNIVKGMYEHIDEIERVHTQGKNIKLKNAIDAMSVPIHPGAQKYYEEQGIIVK